MNPEKHEELQNIFGKDVGINVDQRKKLAKKGKADINPYVMKYRNVYYTCPEFYCKRCERSFLADDLLASDGDAGYSSNRYFDVYKLFKSKIRDISPQQSQNIMDHLGRKKLLQHIAHIVYKIKVIKNYFRY